MTSEMVQLRWSEAADHHESLAVSLRAVLTSRDVQRPYDELLAALGLGTAAVAMPDDALGWWCTYARDACLVETAQLYGLRLRALHPSEATLGLDDSAEYAQHFQDSYVPLIAGALEHGQLVLAWRGWPAPCERLWGVLTNVEGATIIGHTLWHDGQPLPLAGPAHQVYVAEEFRSPMGDAVGQADLFAHVARQARGIWAGTWAAGHGVKTGAAAYRAWQAALRDPPDGAAATLPLYRQQSHAARVHVAARSQLATWLRRVAEALGGDPSAIAADWASGCDRVARCLRPYESPEAAQELLEQSGGVERICRAIDDVCEIEAGFVEMLEALA